MSPWVGGHWGTYWGSLCFRRSHFPCYEDPIRGHIHLTYDLIWRLLLAKPVRSVRPMEPRLLRRKRLRPCRCVPVRSCHLLAGRPCTFRHGQSSGDHRYGHDSTQICLHNAHSHTLLLVNVWVKLPVKHCEATRTTAHWSDGRMRQKAARQSHALALYRITRQ